MKNDPFHFTASPSIADSSHETEASESSGYSNTMRYCIFTLQEKKEILQLVKKYLKSVLNLPCDTKEFKESEWINYFDSLENNQFLSFTKRYIPFYVKLIKRSHLTALEA